MESRGPRKPIANSLCFALITAVAFLMPGCEKKTNPVSAARTFFEQVSAGKFLQAYGQTAFGFQAGQNEKAFEAVVRDLGIPDYQSLQSDIPKIEGDKATLHLDITTRAGQQLPFVVTMTNESGAWRIFAIRSPRDAETGVAENRFTVVGKAQGITGNNLPEPPNEKEMRRLVRESLLSFDQAVAAKSFAPFYEGLSAKWKDQISEEQIARTFQPFVDKQFRISEIADMEAIFDDPPSVDSEGVLTASGYYPTKPIRTVFSLKFTYELPKWKLFDIGKTTTVSGSTIMEFPNPNEKEMRLLIRENLLAFDKAIADRSFKAFYGSLSVKWKSQITEAQIEAAFQPFIDHQYRLADVANTEAILNGPASIDSERMLVVSGYYPTRPFKTVFSLKFIYEIPNWKLFGIDVNLQE